MISNNRLKNRLEKNLNKPVFLKLNQNSQNMIMIQKNNDHYIISVHRRFLHARPAILQELDSFVLNPSTITPSLQRYIQSNENLCSLDYINHCKTKGSHWDLKVVFDQVIETYFTSMNIPLEITWYGRPSKSSSSSSKTLGLFDFSKSLIKIHQTLDHPQVPLYYLSFVIYHEILHYLYPPILRKNGRMDFHHKKFKAIEKLHLDYDRALIWEQRELFNLIESFSIPDRLKKCA